MESEVTQLPLWQQAWAWFEANKKQTLWGTGALVLVGLIVALVLYRRDEADIAAGEALSNVALPQMTGASRGDSPDAYLKVAAAYRGSRAGARALLLGAGGLFMEGKYDEARNQFERFNREYGDSPFKGEALLGIAACLDAQSKTNEAVTAYKNLIDRRPADYVLPQARFALARLYEAQNKPELARTLFEEVERNNPYSSLGSEAGIRLEDLKVKYPNLAPPVVPTPTNAMPPNLTAPSNALPAKVVAPTNAAPPKAEKR
jgi:tetratricopeptide (TPR) repeat protein